MVVDVLVDTGAQVGLVRNGLFPDTCPKSSDRPVRLKIASGGIMGRVNPKWPGILGA